MVLKIWGSGIMAYLIKMPRKFKINYLGKDPATADEKDDPNVY
jgi:hypothetical protein